MSNSILFYCKNHSILKLFHRSFRGTTLFLHISYFTTLPVYNQMYLSMTRVCWRAWTHRMASSCTKN